MVAWVSMTLFWFLCNTLAKSLVKGVPRINTHPHWSVSGLPPPPLVLCLGGHRAVYHTFFLTARCLCGIFPLNTLSERHQQLPQGSDCLAVGWPPWGQGRPGHPSDTWCKCDLATFLGTFLIPAHKNLLRAKQNLQVSMEKVIDEVDNKNVFLCGVIWINSTKSGRPPSLGGWITFSKIPAPNWIWTKITSFGFFLPFTYLLVH